LKFEDDIANELDIIEEAKTYYWFAYALRKRRKMAKAEALLKLASKQFEKHLRTNPRNIEALKYLISSYRLLGRTDAQFKTEIELKKVEAFVASSVHPPQKVEFDKSGISFERSGLRCR
jgi:hypothetical protein